MAVILLSGCAPSTTDTGTQIAVVTARANRASLDVQGQEALADAVESVEQLLSSGRAAYQADAAKKSGLDYCRAGEEQIERGEMRIAIREKSKALYVARQERDPLLSAECARSIALAYSFAGLHKRAMDWADEAGRYLAEAGSRASAARVSAVRATLLKVKADNALAKGDPALAKTWLTEARSITPDYYLPYIFASLAQVAVSQKDLVGADATLDAVTDLPGVTDELMSIVVRTKGNLALARGDLRGAGAFFAYGATLSVQSGDEYGRAWAERGRGQVELAAGRTVQASAAYGNSVQAAERSRLGFRAEELRSGAFGTLQTIFDEAVAVLANQGQWEQAFDVSERGRARSFLDLLRGQAVAGAGRPATAREVVASLPDGTALVSYHILPNQLLVWTLRRDGIRGTTVPVTARDLDIQVRRFTALASQPAVERQLYPAAQALYATLMRPAGLRPDESVVVVPFGILHNVAFAALRNGDRWLIEDHVVAMALAAGGKGSPDAVFPPSRDIVIFSNPDGSLPGADAEALAITKLLPGSAVVSGTQASKARFLSAVGRAQVFHIAAHAEFDPVDPLSSRVRLASAGSTPGDLEAREIYGLSLSNVALLVLSACETSLGAPSPGNEIIGFNRSFLSAGVQNLVATLWNVNDQATAVLMFNFYRNLSGASGPVSMPRALRDAQLILLRTSLTASPYYWAPFTLTMAGREGPKS